MNRGESSVAAVCASPLCTGSSGGRGPCWLSIIGGWADYPRRVEIWVPADRWCESVRSTTVHTTIATTNITYIGRRYIRLPTSTRQHSTSPRSAAPRRRQPPRGPLCPAVSRPGSPRGGVGAPAPRREGRGLALAPAAAARRAWAQKRPGRRAPAVMAAVAAPSPPR
jgi:hypothetical protein